jgi:hypothetical protein
MSLASFLKIKSHINSPSPPSQDLLVALMTCNICIYLTDLFVHPVITAKINDSHVSGAYLCELRYNYYF